MTAFDIEQSAGYRDAARAVAGVTEAVGAFARQVYRREAGALRGLDREDEADS